MFLPQAAGNLGAAVTNALIKSGKFNITVLKRPSSTSTLPATVRVVTADLSSVDAVAAAFKGQDAVISTVGTPGILGQSVFIKAAIAAGVKRFLPSDFGNDLSNPKVSELAVYKNKKAIHRELVDAAASNSGFTYTLFCNNAFLDWGLEQNFLLAWKDGKPKLFDGGNTVFSSTALDSVGQGVVGVLSHPDETKNRFVYIKDIDISQNRLLEIAKSVDPTKTWQEPIHASTAELERASNESLAKSQISPPVMYGLLFRALFGPPEYGNRFAKVDNELLGVKGKTEADVEAILRRLIVG